VTVNNAPKLIGILLAMCLLTAVFATGRLSESGYLGLMGLIVGYLVGNGIAAKNGEPVQPAISESPRHQSHRDETDSAGGA
jgi:ABC-type lipoprotein release transport system permease subunit